MAGPWEKYDGPWNKYGSPAFQNTPGGAATGLTVPRGALDFVNQRDPGIDYATGIPSAGFRAGFSFMSGEAEKARFLDKQVGAGNWGTDSFGAYYVKPEGLQRLGVKSDVPVSIDEQKVTRQDVADVAGDIPAIVGAMGYGLAASGAGLIPGVAMTALGAAAGKSGAEIGKNLAGYREQAPGEIAADIAKEGAFAGVGEAAVRGLRPIARFAAGPGASRMTPDKAQLAESAIAQGFKVRAGSVTDAPILARWEGMVRQIFGDLYAEQNKRAAQSGVQRLQAAAGTSPGKEAAGEAISSSIRAARVQFGENMAGRYSQIDQMVGAPFVPTTSLKDAAAQILQSVPATKSGESAFINPETRKFLAEILNLQDVTTASQMQRVRTMLREAAESPNLVPGISKHDARVLLRAANMAFDDAAAQGGQSAMAVRALRDADAAYREGIRKFDRPVISSITRDASKAGAVDPDMVVDYIIKPEHAFRAAQVKAAVSPETWSKVRAAHAEDLLSNVVRQTDDPLTQIFDGRALRDALDKYGRNTLEVVHGKQWVDDAYRYANALMLANKTSKLSGAIVAANVALHPIANLPKLVWIRAMAKVMEQPGTFNYLTKGLQFGPATKEGAESIARFGTQVIANARDETGSARFTLTEP